MSMRISKNKIAFPASDLWHWHDINLFWKVECIIPPCARYFEPWTSDPWSGLMLAAYVILPVWWEQGINNAELRSQVFGTINTSLEMTIRQNYLRLHGYALWMPAQRMQFRALFVLSIPDWKKEPKSQLMTWRREMKKLTKCLARLRPFQLSGLSNKNQRDRLFVSLKDMARNRTLWWECTRFCCSHQKMTKKNNIWAQS